MIKVVPDDAKLIPDSAERVFEGVIHDVYQWQQELFDGSKTTFEMLKRADSAVAICIVDDRIIVLHDDQPHRGLRMSFPGGRVDPTDPDMLAAVRREVLEETGYTFKTWRLIQVRQPSSKMEWFVHEYVAWDPIGQVTPHFDPGEKIELEALPFEEVRRLVLDQNSYLGESAEFFNTAGSIADLQAIPEFKGQEIDR